MCQNKEMNNIFQVQKELCKKYSSAQFVHSNIMPIFRMAQFLKCTGTFKNSSLGLVLVM